MNGQQHYKILNKQTMNKNKKFNITNGNGDESWKIFVDGVWFDDDEAMAKKFWSENILVEFLDSSYGEIIWCRDNTVDDSYGSDCFYVPEWTTVSEIVRSMTHMFKKPDNDYDPILDEGRGSVAASAANDVYDEFDGRAIINNPDFIDALDDIRPIDRFKKDHPNFDMDLYIEICNQVDEYLQKKNN